MWLKMDHRQTSFKSDYVALGLIWFQNKNCDWEQNIMIDLSYCKPLTFFKSWLKDYISFELWLCNKWSSTEQCKNWATPSLYIKTSFAVLTAAFNFVVYDSFVFWVSVYGTIILGFMFHGGVKTDLEFLQRFRGEYLSLCPYKCRGKVFEICLFGEEFDFAKLLETLFYKKSG